MTIRFTRLTRHAARNLAPGQKLSEHGIAFERLANGDGRYVVGIMVDGVRVHRAIGLESDGTTRQQCEDFIERARTDARHGRLNLPKRRKLVLGFAQAARDYIDRLREEGGRHIPKKRQQIRDHLTKFLGDKPLSKVSGLDVERYKKSRLEAQASPATVNRELATLSHLFTKAIEWKWLEHRPAVIKRLREDKGRITYLTTEQIARLLDAAKHDQSWVIYPFIMIALETSMRRTEVLYIRLEHIDLDKQAIYISQAKAGAREQPMTKDLTEFLRGYVEAAEPDQVWLFPARSATGHAMSIEIPFRRVVAAAGLDPKEVVRHTLRHTAITHLVQAGVDLPTVQRISGHKTMQMVVRYSHQSGEHIRAAMTKLERRYRPLTVVNEET